MSALPAKHLLSGLILGNANVVVIHTTSLDKIMLLADFLGFLFLKLLVSAPHAGQIDDYLFQYESAEKNNMSLVVLHKILSVHKRTGQKVVLVIAFFLIGAACLGHDSDDDTAIVLLNCRLAVVVGKEVLQINRVDHQTVEDQAEKVAHQENLGCPLHNIPLVCASIPNHKSKELDEEKDGGKDAHFLPTEHIDKVSLTQVFPARLVQLTDFDDR